jgi:hypothetical protein
MGEPPTLPDRATRRRRKRPALTLDREMLCRDCGYNLRGLKNDGRSRERHALAS